MDENVPKYCTSHPTKKNARGQNSLPGQDWAWRCHCSGSEIPMFLLSIALGIVPLIPPSFSKRRPRNPHPFPGTRSANWYEQEFWWILEVWALSQLALLVRTPQQVPMARWPSQHSSHLWLPLSLLVLCMVTVGCWVCVYVIPPLIQ